MTDMQRLSNKVRNNIDMLTGCWNRVHVSDSAEEIDTLVKSAKYHASKIVEARLEAIQLDEDFHKDRPRTIPLPTVPEGSENSFKGCLTALKMVREKDTLASYAEQAVAYVEKAAKERKADIEVHNEHPEYEQYK